MCKFLVLNQETPAKQVKLEENKQKVHNLEQENKLLEETLIKNLEKKTNGAKSSKKLQDLFAKLKKLDEIALHLEEKNRNHEILIKKQNKLIAQLKEENAKLIKENQGIKVDEDKMAKSFKDLEKELEEKNKENENLKEMVKLSKISENETEDFDLNQSLCSQESDSFRKSIKKNRAYSYISTIYEKPEITTNPKNEVCLFRQSVQSERILPLQTEEKQCLKKQLHEVRKSRPSLFRKTINYYNEIKMMKLQQNLGFGKLF